jgi:hypothetical protein
MAPSASKMKKPAAAAKTAAKKPSKSKKGEEPPEAEEPDRDPALLAVAIPEEEMDTVKSEPKTPPRAKKTRNATPKAPTKAPARQVLPDLPVQGQELPAQGQESPAQGLLPPIPKKQAQDMAYKLKAMAKAGSGKLLKEYNACNGQGQQAKRHFFYNVYMLDPEVSQKTVRKTDMEDQEEVQQTVDDWFTADQIAGFKGISERDPNYEALRQAAVQDLPERKHSDENLANLGVLQYKYVKTTSTQVNTKRRRLELEEGVDQVSAEDFSNMRLSIQGGPQQKMIGSKSSGSAGSGPAQGGSLHKAQEDSQNKELDMTIDHVQHYKQQYKKVKGLLSAISGEDHGLQVVIAKVKEMDSGDAMKGACLQKLDLLRKDITQAMEGYHKQFILLPKEAEEAEAEAKAAQIQPLLQALTEKYKGWKKESALHKKFAAS